MRLLSTLFLAAFAASAFAASLGQGERDRALSELHASRKQFLDSIDGLSDAQWNFKPAPAVWSAAECAEHVALTEDLLWEMLTKKIMAGPPQPDKKPEVKGKDESVLKVIADRGKKAQAPESIQPRGAWPTRPALLEHFRQSRERLLEYVRTTPDDLRSHFAPHPATGLMDGYQWILTISAHAVRHTAQIDEVKSDPRFPK
jgi:uncharacterized damage-inducible protein DinB